MGRWGVSDFTRVLGVLRMICNNKKMNEAEYLIKNYGD